MAGTFVATPSKALTIEHEPTGRELTHFKPGIVHKELSEIDVLAAYGVTLRDDNKLHDLAVAKIAIVVDIVDWLERNMKGVGKPSLMPQARGVSLLSREDAMKALGFEPRSIDMIDRWRRLARAAHADQEGTLKRLVLGWKMRMGMEWQEKRKPLKDADKDIQVEMIFRAYTKLDPDQRIELKQRIMDFEKSYKDPFKDAKEW